MSAQPKGGISPLAANSVAQAPRRSKGLCFLNTPVAWVFMWNVLLVTPY